MPTKQEIADLVFKHFNECADGLVDKGSSLLNRGEGTEIDFFILKIDLAKSTTMLLRSRRETYLKLAHTFLSSVDRITQYYGADESQAEYAGDSVQAYFPSAKADAMDVLRAAACCRRVPMEIKNLPGAVGTLPLRTRVILHRGRLVMANIGPWGNVHHTAIGLPLHIVGHLESKAPINGGLATKDFASALDVRDRAKYLSGQYEEKRVEIPPSPTVSTGLFGLGEAALRGEIPAPTRSLLDLGALPPPPARGLLNLGALPDRDVESILRSLYPTEPQPAPQPQYRVERELKHWQVLWPAIEREMGFSSM